MMDYEKLLSVEAQKIPSSGIRRFFSIAEEMQGVISLGVGEPDFATPWIVRRAGIESLERGKTWYSANAGFKELRVQIAGYLQRRFGLTYDPDKEMFVSVGGSEAIDIAMRAVLNPGDEVLLPTPCFVCYDPIAKMCGATVKSIQLREEDEFRLTADQLRAAISEKTKLLVLPFPNNPTGAIMSRSDLEAIAEVLKGTDILVLSDEIYAELTYGGERHCAPATLSRDMWDRTITINGFSKAFAMTGWRLGYATGPARVIKQMMKVHQFAIMCPPTLSQYAAIEALRNGEEDVIYMRNEYDQRRKFLLKRFEEMGIDCFEAKGAFYLFPCIKKFGMSSNEFAERILNEQKLAVVPGSAFGASGEGFLRISYAYSLRDLKRAVERIEAFVSTL
jgi:aminotransferase